MNADIFAAAQYRVKKARGPLKQNPIVGYKRSALKPQVKS
jgi:hypothetical protein